MERVINGQAVTAVPLKDDSGKAVTKTETFTPETEEGDHAVGFTFSGAKLEGRTIVAYETMQYHNRCNTKHKMSEMRRKSGLRENQLR